MIFNSCCVTNDAVKSLKKNIKLFHKSNPGVKIIVTGCAAESEKHNLENMKDGIHFKYTDKYKQYEGFNIEEYQEEIKSYNRYPLLDSIYIQTLKYRFIKKCKSNLYIAEKFYEDIENKDFDIDKYKLEYNKLSKEDKAK